MWIRPSALYGAGKPNVVTDRQQMAGTTSSARLHTAAIARSHPNVVEGRAIAPPRGASSARLATTWVNHPHRVGGRDALCMMCIGMSQNIALDLEI